MQSQCDRDTKIDNNQRSRGETLKMPSGTESFFSLPFTVVDVFTESRYSGNPLAIVSLPPSTEFAPSQAQLQSVAIQFNLSETIFLEYATPEDIKEGVRRARIFTTTREILFAGHPTIGAATYLLVHKPSSQAPHKLVPGAGPIPISTESSKPGYVSAIIPQTYHQHAAKCSAPRLLELHSTLSPFVTEDRTFPIVSIVHGMTFVLVELQNLDALAAAKLGNATANILANSGILDKGWEYNAPISVYLYVRNAEAEQDGVEAIRTRMLIRGIEDPATGSAASALTGYLALDEAKQKGAKREWKIVQGVEMGRRSEISVKVSLIPEAIDTIELSGTAVVVSEGTIRV
jgi:PhzF family phenazine biosynthesis protein